MYRRFEFLLLGLLFVAACPIIAGADNCGSLGDCFGTVASAAAAIASIATGITLMSLIGALFGTEEDVASAKNQTNPFDGMPGWYDKLTQDATWSGMAFALAGAVFSGVEKFKDWGVIARSFNPGTGFEIPGTHLAYPWRSLGTVAKSAGAGLALYTQFNESKEIWQSQGSTLNRSIREATSLSVNIGTTAASATLVAITAETGPGLALGFIGAAALGVAGEGVKMGLSKLVSRYIP